MLSEQKKIIVAVVMTAFMAPFMANSINVAVPAMAEDFKLSPDVLNWAITAFLIGSAATLLPFGRLADIKGRRKIYTIGLIGMCITTFPCAITDNFLSFAVLRFLQGIAMSMIFGTSMALLVSCVESDKRGKIIGMSAASTYTGLSVAPFIGGFITDYLTWRLIFWLSGAILLVNLLLILTVKSEWYGDKHKKLDYLGSVICSVMIISLLYGLSDWTRNEWAHYLIIPALILFGIFIWQQSKSKSPLLELAMFKNTVFSMSNLAAFIHYSATFSLSFVLSLYLQIVRGMDAVMAGTVLLIQPCLMAILSPKAGALSDKYSSRILASVGMAIMMVGLFAFSFLGTDTSLYLICFNMAFIGIGFSLFSAPNNNAIMGSVEAKFYGVASSFLAIMRLTGMAVSMSLVSLILSTFTANVLASEYAAHLLVASKYTFTVFGCLCILALIASLMRGKQRNVDRI